MNTLESVDNLIQEVTRMTKEIKKAVTAKNVSKLNDFLYAAINSSGYGHNITNHMKLNTDALNFIRQQANNKPSPQNLGDYGIAIKNAGRIVRGNLSAPEPSGKSHLKWKQQQRPSTGAVSDYTHDRKGNPIDPELEIPVRFGGGRRFIEIIKNGATPIYQSNTNAKGMYAYANTDLLDPKQISDYNQSASMYARRTPVVRNFDDPVILQGRIKRKYISHEGPSGKLRGDESFILQPNIKHLQIDRLEPVKRPTYHMSSLGSSDYFLNQSRKLLKNSSDGTSDIEKRLERIAKINIKKRERAGY